MKKILITGGAGYIGSSLATALINFGYKVTVIDKLKYDSGALNHLYLNKNFKFIKGDVRDKNLMKSLVRVNEFIIPLAALVGAPLCDKFKREAVTTNLDAIKLILSNLKRKNKLIFLTTNSGYGVGEKNKFCTEETPLRPISLYGRTKCDAEDKVRTFKNHICFRLATVFGSSYRMRSDLLVNNFVLTAVEKKKLDIFEPQFRRNFIHVKDVVRAIIFSINNFNKLKGNIYNLGLSTANITKIKLAKKVKKYLPKIKITIRKNKKDPDKRDYFVSNKKIEKTGFKTRVSLKNGITELIKGFKFIDNLKYRNA